MLAKILRALRLGPLVLRLGSLTFGLAALTAASPAGAQERLHLESFGDLPLYRLGTRDKDRDATTILDGDAQAGVEGAFARGAAPTEGRPFALTAGLGFGLRHKTADLLQIRSEASIPLPVAIGSSPGPMRIWDVDGAHRIRAQIGLGGLSGDHLEKGRGGADVEVEGSLWQGGKYGTSFVRMDVGPYPFLDARGKATVAPRLAMEREVAIAVPVTAEIRHVEVDRPVGIYAFTSERVSSGLAIKPYAPMFSHGSIELVGAGWEVVHFAPPPGAPRPRLGGAERIDLRLLHFDAVVFSPERDLDAAVNWSFGGVWIHDPTSQAPARVSTFAASIASAIHGYPDHKDGGIEIGLGAGGTYDAIFLADGSLLTRRARGEGFFDASFLKRRVGGSIRGALDELMDIGKDEDHHPKRGAVSAEWWLSPIRPLELGLDFTSTQLCVSPQTQSGPAWCHRFGVFLRASGRGSKDLKGGSSPPDGSAKVAY
jgi:hypothetical protein